MKSNQVFFLILFMGLLMGCELDPCQNVDCGSGDCDQGVCDCPDGFVGANCEIKLCFGVPCINGNCNLQNESCICNLNSFGEECNVLCVNGEFENGACNCSEGYEGFTCQTKSRGRFLGWWGCEEWIWTSEIGDSIFQGPLLGSIKFVCGDNIADIEFFPTVNSTDLMLLNSENRIKGQVTKSTINFEFQNLFPQNLYSTVYGSASLDGPLLNME